MVVQGAGTTAVDYVSLSGDELWLDVFYFVIDEIDSSLALNHFLQEILTAGGRARMRITAYAIGAKTAQVDKEIRVAYEQTKLTEDLALTPAA